VRGPGNRQRRGHRQEVDVVGKNDGLQSSRPTRNTNRQAMSRKPRAGEGDHDAGHEDDADHDHGHPGEGVARQRVLDAGHGAEAVRELRMTPAVGRAAPSTT
jgi:hypothetical protein